jgi:hypothetical protein
MHLYIVTDVNRVNRLVAFRDHHGRYHAAHCTSQLPQVGEEMQGSLPEQGFTLLIGSDGGVSRMTFSQVNFGKDWVSRVLHPPVSAETGRASFGCAAGVKASSNSSANATAGASQATA